MAYRSDWVKHGRARRGKKTRLYGIWIQMRNRCNNPDSTPYERYGGRGIRVCSEWDTFLPFEAWALANGYADNLTIDRKDNDGNYEPSNCRWLTRGKNTQESWNSRKRECRSGVRHSIATISKVKSLIAAGEKQSDVMRQTGVSRNDVSRIARGERWGEVEPQLQYVARQATKIQDSEVPLVRRRVAAGETMASLAREYGVDPSTISVICSNKSRKTRTLPVFCD